MAAYLPVELVGEIWRAASELFIETDHKTVLEIATTCTIGYYAVIPVLYRTLLMNGQGAELAMRIFDTGIISNAPTLSAPPAQRLCPLVRRLCTTLVPDGFTLDHLQRLTRLEMICDSESLQSFLPAPLAPTLTHIIIWTTDWPQQLPHTLTHVSLYCFFDLDWETRYGRLKAYVADTLPDGVTHFALSFCYSLPPDVIAKLMALLQSVLVREGISVVTIWLFGDAADDMNYKQLLRAIAALPLEDRDRVRLWRDMRSAFRPINLELRVAADTDIVAGRTLWTEARSIIPEELSGATVVHD